MIDDLLKSPSQKSYMTKLILAALTLLALIIAWMSRRLDVTFQHSNRLSPIARRIGGFAVTVGGT